MHSSLADIYFICFICLTSISAWASPCPKIKYESYSATNAGLKSLSYQQRSASNVVICARDCHSDSRCKSFTYHMCSRVCELGNSTTKESSDGLVPIPNSVYFDSSQETLLLSVVFPDDRYCSCKKLLEVGHNKSGVYTIFPAAYSDGLDVYCDMDTDDGGWIVIQRRQDGSEEFYRNWTEYESGFGNLSGEFWLGNKAIQDLTKSGGPWVLRIDMEDWEGEKPWVEYSGFQLLGNFYKMRYQGYNPASTAGNSLFASFNQRFQTKDEHGMHEFPLRHHGAWWYAHGAIANLNGAYYHHNDPSFDHLKSIYWPTWKSASYKPNYALRSCSMKISENA